MSLFTGVFASSSKNDLAGLADRLTKPLFYLREEMFINPFFKEAVWNLQQGGLGFERDKTDGFYPDIKILLADFFFQGVVDLGPNIFHREPGSFRRESGETNENGKVA